MKDQRNKAEINLSNIIGNGIIATFHFQSGYNTKTGIYIPKGQTNILIQKNNLKGGFIGNTLLKKTNDFSGFSYQSNIDIRIGDCLFSKCQLSIELNREFYILKSDYNYLRLNAEIKKYS